jgi:hypothetical protein
MQHEKIKIEGSLCLPTGDMKVCRWDNMTTFYLDEGQLHWPHGDCETVPALYIEAGGDAMVLCAEELRDILEPALNLCVSMQWFDRRKLHLGRRKGTIIETRIPRAEVKDFFRFNGAADFVACRHPSHAVRVEMIAKLWQRERSMQAELA